MVENKDLETMTDSCRDTSSTLDDKEIIQYEELKKKVNFSDGNYIETCIIRKNKKGVTLTRTYSWEKTN